MSLRPVRPPFARRALLTGAAGAAAALLASCGSTADAPMPTVQGASGVGNVSSAATTTPAALGASGGVAATAPRTATPKGELRYALGIHFVPTLDPTKDGFTLVFNGPAETLTRLTPQGKVEPWLAESVASVDATTWRVTLRRNAKFHDGTPVDADAVIAAMRKNWETQPAAHLLLSRETQLTARDATTVEFRTPRPSGDLPNSLAAQNFVIFKPNPAGGFSMTGAYRPTKLVVDQELTMEAFSDHWGGPPPIAKITCRSMTDANSRALALQSGELDMLWGLPPDIVKTFGPEYETTATPSTRQHMIVLNHAKPPFNDRAVREAMSLGIDRAALNAVALDGKGAPAVGVFPPGNGADVVPIQSTDAARARQLLDDAGWNAGSDGVRAKGGQRLAFTLYSYPGRAELTPIAVQIQAQLKPLGFDVRIQEVQNITAQTKDGNFEAAMYSVSTLVTGDPLYFLATAFTKGGASNIGGYANPQMEATVEQLRNETDPAKRQTLSRQAQEIARVDVPHLYLVAAPIITAARRGKVRGFVASPNDIYFVSDVLSLG